VNERLLPILLLLLIATLSAADHASAREEGWFVTAQYGRADYDVLLTGNAPWWGRVDDSAGSLAVGLGYAFNPNLTARVMYERTTGLEAINVCPATRVCPAISFRRSTDADNWSLTAAPTLPLANGWNLFGTLGVMRWRLDPDDGPQGRIASDRGTGLVYGAGVGYLLGTDIHMALEHQRSGSDYVSTRLGFTYRF
jgi:opacity protein-like surface antigen